MKIKSIALIASLALLPLSVHADGINSLQHFNENIKHFSGNFTQTVKNAKKTQKTSGSFAIARPEHFRWIYEKPYQQTIIGDGKTLWLYDVDLAQRQLLNLGVKKASDGEKHFLADNTALAEFLHIAGSTFLFKINKWTLNTEEFRRLLSILERTEI